MVPVGKFFASFRLQKKVPQIIADQPNQDGNKMYSFELNSELSELNTLRQHLNHCAQHIGLSPDCILEINISLDELFTNIISYGFEDDLDHPVSFSLRTDQNALIISVEDDGKPFNPLEVEAPETPIDLDNIKIGGLGIFITRKLMDEIFYKRECGKNKLTLKKAIAAD